MQLSDAPCHCPTASPVHGGCKGSGTGTKCVVIARPAGTQGCCQLGVLQGHHCRAPLGC